MHAPVRASSVHPVVRVTGNFTSESPLHHAAREALLAAFDQGWADPKKLSQGAAKAAILRNQSLENIGARLGIRPDSIEVLGEPHLGHFLGISGLLREDSNFYFSAIDKGKIRAIARSHKGGTVNLPTDSTGQIEWPSEIPTNSVISLQLANGETGVIQNLQSLPNAEALIAIDATASGPRVPLPEKWDTALFDSQSWMGPAGLAILAIKNSAAYNYPIPRIAPIKSPGSYSLPLLIASAVALENFHDEDIELRKYAISQCALLQGCSVVAPESNALPHIFSLVIDGISAESLVRESAAVGVDIDSGSACSPEDLQPSHVLAAMGYKTDGHLRITLHPGSTKNEIDHLVKTISEISSHLRG